MPPRAGRPGPTGFALADFIDAHAAARHDLARSGMYGALRTVPRILAAPQPPCSAEELRRQLARRLGVAPDRLFLTHGAHEANLLAVAYLARDRPRPFRFRVDLPEYPQLWGAAEQLGGRRSPGDRGAVVRLVSNPHNPTGRLVPVEELTDGAGDAEALLVDETFREFTAARSVAATAATGVWASGTFTKAYGGDDVRVGWLVAPSEAADRFRDFYALALDHVPPASLAAAAALLRHRDRVRREVDGIWRQNAAYLRREVGGAPELFAPVWFDPGPPGVSGDQLQAAGLRASVLVCSGRFFGVPRGVRVCLTRRTFPRDLRLYLEVRASVAARSRRRR